MCGIFMNKGLGQEDFNFVYGHYRNGYIQGPQMIYIKNVAANNSYMLEQLSFKAPAKIFKVLS